MLGVTPTVSLLAPPTDVAVPPTLDGAQRAALDAALALRPGGALVVAGAPGTGRTTVAVEIATAALERGVEPAEVLVLAASRRSASAVRDVLTARAGRTLSAPLVRTAASAAFAVLAARAQGLEEPAPTLVSGPEQDLLLADLLAGHAAGARAPARAAA
jgi:superfamily I DNA/RNA helicase